MSKFAVFDTNAGFLQWLDDAESQDNAIRAFHHDVGLVKEVNDDLDIALVSDEQAAALQAWQDHGAEASQYPKGIETKRVDADHIAMLLGFVRP